MNTQQETKQHNDVAKKELDKLTALQLLKKHAHPGCRVCKGSGARAKIIKEPGKKGRFIQIRIPCLCSTLSLQKEALEQARAKAEAESKPAEDSEPQIIEGHDEAMKPLSFTFKPEGVA